MTKYCPACAQERPLSAFERVSKATGRPVQVARICNSCQSEQQIISMALRRRRTELRIAELCKGEPRRCGQCGETKALREFYSVKTGELVLSCNQCRAALPPKKKPRTEPLKDYWSTAHKALYPKIGYHSLNALQRADVYVAAVKLMCEDGVASEHELRRARMWHEMVPPPPPITTTNEDSNATTPGISDTEQRIAA